MVLVATQESVNKDMIQLKERIGRLSPRSNRNKERVSELGGSILVDKQVEASDVLLKAL